MREFICRFYKAEEGAESIKVKIIHEVALQQQSEEEEEELKVNRNMGEKERNNGQK